jgi:hypothetical protein
LKSNNKKSPLKKGISCNCIKRFKFNSKSLSPKIISNAQVATVTVVGGPVVPRPPEGWTTPTAEAFCADYIRQKLAAYLYIFYSLQSF